MQRKETPIQIIDTHAGFGSYPLSDLTYEAQNGILALLQGTWTSDLLNSYLKITAPSVERGLFPGSPLLAAILKRPIDSLWPFEKYEEPREALKESLAGFEKTYVKEGDGFQGLKSLLPPPSKRCLVLIDPPYERPEEYSEVALTLDVLAYKFRQGTYILWYPHSKRLGMWNPILEQTKIWGDRSLTIDYYLQHKHSDERLTGAGLLILNPPFKLKSDLQQAIPDLKQLGFDLILS